MKRQVELTDEQIQELKVFYNSKIEELENKIIYYEDLLDALSDPNTSQTKMVRTKKPQKSDSYTWRSICTDVLRDMDRPMTTDELYEKILAIDPALETRGRRSVISSISGSLSQNVNKGVFKSFENPDGSGNLWALPEMLEDGYPTEYFVDRLKEDGYNIKYREEVEKRRWDGGNF